MKTQRKQVPEQILPPAQPPPVLPPQDGPPASQYEPSASGSTLPPAQYAPPPSLSGPPSSLPPPSLPPPSLPSQSSPPPSSPPQSSPPPKSSPPKSSPPQLSPPQNLGQEPITFDQLPPSLHGISKEDLAALQKLIQQNGLDIPPPQNGLPPPLQQPNADLAPPPLQQLPPLHQPPPLQQIPPGHQLPPMPQFNTQSTSLPQLPPLQALKIQPQNASPPLETKANSATKTEIKEKAEGEVEQDVHTRAFQGIHPHDKDAKVTIEGLDRSQSIYKAARSFTDLGLSTNLLKGVYAMNFSHPSKIQAEALPLILGPSRPNFIGQAHHGSGKTAAFALGMIQQVDVNQFHVQALAVVPTRELARQVYDVVCKLSKFCSIGVFLAVPGCENVRGGIRDQIVIGTPGKLVSKFRFKEINGSKVRIFVADEADLMISRSGLGENTLKIKRWLTKNCQILLFSATFPERVSQFAAIVAPKAIKITIAREKLSLDVISQFYMDCKKKDKRFECLTNLYAICNYGQSIIFVHTVQTAKMLAKRMRSEGYHVSLLHGKGMMPKQRDQVMDDFREGRSTVLISTNVLSRGVDVLAVNVIINYDIPLNRQNKPDPETYIHRIGRSGRFGRRGVAINFVYDRYSKEDLRFIARYYNKDIKCLPDDMEKVEEIISRCLGLND